MNPTGIDLNARSGLRRSLLGYFVASIVLLVALVAAWSWIERRAGEDIDTLQRASRTYTDELSRLRLLLAEERIAWSEVLLRGWEQARYHDLLRRYYERESQSRSALERIGAKVPDTEAVRGSYRTLQAAHADVSRLRRDALREFNRSNENAHVLADRLLGPIDDVMPTALSRFSELLTNEERDRIASLQRARGRIRAILLAVLGAIAVAALAGFAWLLDRRVGWPAQRASELAVLVTQAEAIAGCGFWNRWPDGSMYWSTGMDRLFGLNRSDGPPLHRTLARIRRDDRRALLRAVLRQRSGDGVQRALVRLGDAASGRSTLHAIFQTRDLGAGRGVVRSGVVVDVSLLTEQREALSVLNAELEERVLRRTAELEAARDEAQRLAHVKSDFLANMSHELRTPLNAVLGFAHIGLRDSTGSPAQAQFGRILGAGDHLLHVINDILDLSRIEAGKFVVDSRVFALRAVIADASSFVIVDARSKGLAYHCEIADDVPNWVRGDALRLQQTLVNLLSNAVKFTEHGHVRLDVTAEGDGRDTVRFVVGDTGIGIDAGQVARLFEPFEQADNSSTRARGGTGLGLTICSRLAALMGGSIAVTSTPGSGSSFTLRLPLPQAPEPPQLPTQPATERGRLLGVRLLAAEDDEVNRILLEELLRHEGAEVVFVGDGQQAVQRLDEHGVAAFDAILMDVQMPVLDGYEAARRIRAVHPELPVIGLTAHALPEDRRLCLEAGMVEYVVKPIDLAELVAAIRRHVRDRDRRATAEAASDAPVQTSLPSCPS
jgi:signal transduction histidine kinase/AmiR/NasT family two-component response regulator